MNKKTSQSWGMTRFSCTKENTAAIHELLRLNGMDCAKVFDCCMSDQKFFVERRQPSMLLNHITRIMHLSQGLFFGGSFDVVWKQIEQEAKDCGVSEEASKALEEHFKTL